MYNILGSNRGMIPKLKLLYNLVTAKFIGYDFIFLFKVSTYRRLEKEYDVATEQANDQ